MKTYEEMARDVLKRRDEELQKNAQTTHISTQAEIFYPVKQKKRRLLPAIAIPCAAAIAVGAVTVGTRYGGLWGNSASVESSEGELPDDLVDRPVVEPGAPEKLQNKDDQNWNLIRVLDEVPDYLVDMKHAFFNFEQFSEPEYIPYTPNELNSYYGIDFDRLGRFHDDWEEKFTGNFGIVVYNGKDDIPVSETVNGKKILSTRSEITYNLFDADNDTTCVVRVEAARIGIGMDNVFSPFDPSVYKSVFSSDNFSVISGYDALIYHNTGEDGVDRLEAIIEMGNTLVRITTDDNLSDFLLYLGEYTQSFDGTMIDGYKRINILDSTPEYIRTIFDDAHLVLNDLDLDKPPILFTDEEINNWYGVELDRLGKLHKDWKLNEGFGGKNGYVYLYDGDETDSENIGDYMFDGRKVIYESGGFNYVVNDGGDRDNECYNYDLGVHAGHIGISYGFDPFDSSICPDPGIISYVNGKEVLIWHTVDLQGHEHLEAFIKYGQTIVHMLSVEPSEDGFVKILNEFTAPELSDDKQDETPHDDVINLLDTVPDYMSTHSFLNGYSIEGLTVQIMLTRDELNSYFGVETNRLGRLHPDWNEARADGDMVTLYNGEVTDAENSGDWMIGGRKVVNERSLIAYDYKGDEGAELLIWIEHVGFRENSFSPFDSSVYSGKFSHDNFSYLNGRKMLIFYNTDEDIPEHGEFLEAIIDFGYTLVNITGFELSEDEFVSVLDEFTKPDDSVKITPWSEIPQERFADRIAEVEATDNAVHSITILEDIPDFLLDHALYKNVDMPYPQYNFPLTNEEMNSWFGVELDRLSRLHKDWELIENKDGIHGNLRVYGGEVTDAENKGGLTVCGRKAVWEINGFAYDFKDGGYKHDYWDKHNFGYDVTVTANHIGVPEEYFDLFESCPDQSMISYLNGKKALIYEDVDLGYGAIRADIKYGDTIVTITGFELTPHEFMEIVDEFTKPDNSVTITPWKDIPQDKFAEIIRTEDPIRLPEG